MRWLFWLLLILALAIGVSLLVGNNNGYVLIVRPPYRLELSLNLLLLIIALTYIVLDLCLRAISYTRRLPATVRAYKEAQRRKKGHGALINGLHALVEGRYVLAEKSAALALKLGEDAGLSALIAARASHKLKRKQQRDRYLAEAEQRAPKAAIARLLSHIELLLDDHDYDEAARLMARLEEIEPRYPPALRLALKIQLRLKHWEQVLATVQQLEKSSEIEPWQAEELRQQALQNLLTRHGGDLSSLQKQWQKVAEKDRLNSRLAYLAGKAFIDCGASQQAAAVIEASLRQQWDSKLAGLWGYCISANPQKQLQQAEDWLLSHEGDTELLLALGKMCARANLWGKAQSYLEASISVKPTVRAHVALARLLEQRGEHEPAFQHYRLGAQLASLNPD